ncbi:hypothetical protein MMC30_008994 [Trapelia coarctata]|nr:hypothetical protein [Trapelia coarctata]
MATAKVNHNEEYAKVGSPVPRSQRLLTAPSYTWQALTKHILQITTNLANVKNVWGTSSRQYAEADAIAAEYLRTFMGPVKASTEMDEAQQVLQALLGNHVPGDAKTLNLVFRPRSPAKSYRRRERDEAQDPTLARNRANCQTKGVIHSEN